MKLTGAPIRALALVLQVAAIAAAAQGKTNGINDILQSLLDGMKRLDNEVLAYGGGKPDALRDAAKDLYENVMSGLTGVEGLPDLSLNEAIGLRPLTKEISDAGQTFLRNLVSKKWGFEDEQLCGYMNQYTTEFNAATDELFTAIGRKCPQVVQAEARAEIAESTRLFHEAATYLVPDNCVNDPDKLAHSVGSGMFPDLELPPLDEESDNNHGDDAPKDDNDASKDDNDASKDGDDASKNDDDAPKDDGPVSTAVWYTNNNDAPNPGTTSTSTSTENPSNTNTQQAPEAVTTGEAPRVSGVSGPVAGVAAMVAALVL
ncbi:hypothetical protein F4809DRAFT_638153 [Biscogniauxia mediterranea]|nr:hypothetical protein F4809DRAFT_638153 [Biscogniauxia mediterranea]